jgi:hypothetical protein
VTSEHRGSGADTAQVSGRLTPEERAARDRRSQRVSHALRNPTHVTNEHAMFDALRDAMWNRPTIGAIRRGQQTSDQSEAFDWGEVQRRADVEHAAEIEAIENPSRSQERPEKRPSFSVVTGDELLARTRNREHAYGWQVLVDECRRVVDTPPGNRNNTLASASFKVGRGAVGPGFLERDECYSNLLGAALDSGLPEREARAVIRSGLYAGAQKPRPLRPFDERPA